MIFSIWPIMKIKLEKKQTHDYHGCTVVYTYTRLPQQQYHPQTSFLAYY